MSSGQFVVHNVARSTNNHRLGREGEERVARYWQDHGWFVLARNYRGRGFEIDLIVQRGSTLVFVEVKARRCLDDWQLHEFITEQKRRALQRGAEQFIAERCPDADCYRFDLCLLSANKITVVTDVLAS